MRNRERNFGQLEYSEFCDSLNIGSEKTLGLGIVRFLTQVTESVMMSSRELARKWALWGGGEDLEVYLGHVGSQLVGHVSVVVRAED